MTVFLASDHATFENNCVKTNEERPVLSVGSANLRQGLFVSGNIRFVQVFQAGESVQLFYKYNLHRVPKKPSP